MEWTVFEEESEGSDLGFEKETLIMWGSEEPFFHICQGFAPSRHLYRRVSCQNLKEKQGRCMDPSKPLLFIILQVLCPPSTGTDTERNACPHAHSHQQLELVRASNLGASIARFLVMPTPFQRTQLTLVSKKYQR